MATMAVALDRNLFLAYYFLFFYFIYFILFYLFIYFYFILLFFIIIIYYYLLLLFIFYYYYLAYYCFWHIIWHITALKLFDHLIIDSWFPNLTRTYGNNDRRPRQKFVFGILQLIDSS